MNSGEAGRLIHNGGSFPLRYSLAMVVLLCAACLEAGGDALMRVGLRSPTHTRAALFFLLGGLVLTFYGTRSTPRLGTSGGFWAYTWPFSSSWRN